MISNIVVNEIANVINKRLKKNLLDQSTVNGDEIYFSGEENFNDSGVDLDQSMFNGNEHYFNDDSSYSDFNDSGESPNQDYLPRISKGLESTTDEFMVFSH